MRAVLFLFVAVALVATSVGASSHAAKLKENIDKQLKRMPRFYPDQHLPEGNTTVLAVGRNQYHLHVFALGTDNDLWRKYQSVNGGNWTSWLKIAEPSCGGKWEADPAVGVNKDGTLEVFIRTQVNLDLWQFYLQDPSDPNSWSVPRESSCLAPPAPCWNSQPVFPTSDVSVTHDSVDGRLQLYYRGFDGTLYMVQQKEPGSPEEYEPPVQYNVIFE